jgi:hypothetical protein
MINANAYRAISHPLAGEYLGKWNLTIELREHRGRSVTMQPLYFERLFDSREDAEGYAAGWFGEHFA